ncbi:albusnodin/ikarugamycin family macrolactam cyclase [Streptomyces sp. DSM 41527]|uniref:asparagine synthase (glutamine-hydrolyzing) n=1 Tax=Streptomyces mooreae TaxID=3075523 RepID=A0ABU2T8C6_9ACTN|nr:albusnodin/ikarugamycin family macrolactam cyclase [Streptomyces sp. DSM 41527]MDT0456960.1 albusnodin/ikarugamycin family macrolactam cyclase [Streptomyces sp. DSM 41527]
MRWSAGWCGGTGHDRLPAGGRAVCGLDRAWTVGWPGARVRAVRQGPVTLAVIGECGADKGQLERALPVVRAKGWLALTRWPGSYLTIARSGETLAVIGDLAGQHPVYWRTEGGGTWWSTSAAALAALDGAPADPTALGAHLALAQPDVLGQWSLFRSVSRVPTGHLLLITPQGAGAVRYEPVKYEPVDLRDAAPTVRAALTQAVGTRCDGRPVSADLAGLDSTTLACLAAQRGPVTTVTFADARLRDDDLAYAVRTAATVPGLAHQTVPGSPDTVYYAGLEDLSALPVTDAPNAYVVTASIKRMVLAAVAARGSAGVHLTGSAGDAVLSAPSAYLADLLRERQHRRAWQHAQAHARLRHTSALAMLRRARPAARTGLAGAWRQTAAELRRPARPWVPQAERPVVWTPLLATADWMSTDLRGRLASALDVAAELAPAPARLAAWADRQDLARVGADTTGWRDMALAEHGIEVAAPFLDNEVIRACLAVPADQRGAPGRYKPLLGAAFAHTGVLPPFVLSRVTKGGFNALAYAGLRAHSSVLRDLLGPSSRLAAAGLVTEAPVAEMLQRAALGQPTALRALHLAVAAEVWLRQLETAPAWWEANSHVATV